jgi:RimJ/RimL family protein N-acetyltransferase
VIADNQQPIYDELVQANMAAGLGGTHTGVDASRLQSFLHNIRSERRQPDRFREWIDGYGADRIAAALDSGVWLRAATPQDCQMYFDWANDPLVRQCSLQSDEIRWSDHVDWFHPQLVSKQQRLFVAMRAEQPVGQIRFSQSHDGAWLIAFSIAAQARGSGLGGELLRLGIAAMQFAGEQSFVAKVKHNNTTSAKCFDRLGWCKTSCEETYEYRNQ